MNQSVSSLLSLLPGNSFVMGKGVSQERDPGVEAPVCRFCGQGASHGQWIGPTGADLVFLLEKDSFQGSAEEVLLHKICDAMKIGLERVAVLTRGAGIPEAEWNSCVPFQWKELKLCAPKMVVVLSESIGRSILGGSGSKQELRGSIHTRFDLNVLITEELSGMIQNPNLKKQAWEDLKLAIPFLTG